MRASILSIFDFLAPSTPNSWNDDNGTEEHSTESNHSDISSGNNTTTNATGNTNAILRTFNSTGDTRVSSTDRREDDKGMIDV